MIGAQDLGRVIFGCGNFGGMGSSAAYRDHGETREAAFALLDLARSAGLTRFDTANAYGGGASETWLGEWLSLQDRPWRETIQIATKLGNPAACPKGERPLSRSQVAFHIDRSLGRLGVERLDLLYLHEFDPATPLEETLDAVGAALASGKVKEFGVSNARSEDLEDVLRLASPPVRSAFGFVQNEFNALCVGDQEDVIPLCRSEGLKYVAFSPLAGGLLTGKYRRGEPAAPGTRIARAADHYADRITEASFQIIDGLAAKAEERGWTTSSAALRFVLDAPGVDALIIAPRNASQFEAYGLQSSALGGTTT